MLSNYIRTSFRKFRRSKVHTIVNLVGLTMGLLCALIIFQKVRFEQSFDAFQEDGDLVFRIVREEFKNGETTHGAGFAYPAAEALRNDFPFLSEVTLVDSDNDAQLIAVPRDDGSSDRFREESVAFAEQGYLDMFTLQWLAGNRDEALTQPGSVVLTRSLALKYFGTEDVLGKTISYRNALDLNISGLIADPPLNTELPFSMIIARKLGGYEGAHDENDNWGSISSSVQVFVKLADPADRARLEAGLSGFISKYRDIPEGELFTLHLQPLLDMHFDPRYGTYGQSDAISEDAILTLKLVGLFLLITACINFINLNVVLVLTRAREVAVRKVMGGTARQVVGYFMTETGIAVGAALMLAFLLANPVLKMASSAIGEGLSVQPASDPVLLLASLAAAVLVTVLAGLYPAMLQSRIKPAIAIRGDGGARPGSFLTVRRGLVAFQFAISQVFIVCTLVAMNQMRFVNAAPLGYETEAVVEFDIPTQDDGKAALLQQRLANHPAIQLATWSNSGATSGSTWISNLVFHGDGEPVDYDAQMKLVGSDYVSVYGMEVIAGRDFVPTDSANGVLVNETFAAEMGYDDPVDILGSTINVWAWQDQPVIGVLRDFNTNSFHREKGPVIVVPTQAYSYLGAVKAGSADLQEVLAVVEEMWTETYPDFLFEYEFLDDTIAQMYESEQATQTLIRLFAMVAILIGCIGLYGLVSFTTSQRNAEVGIRKVLGAKAEQIVSLFAREFVMLVLVGFAMAAPVAYVVMNTWLDNFAYRIDLGPAVFILALGASLLIAVGTVGSLTLKAAWTNPVDAINR
jgi:ABC-type antimicrobial peptide transport system permease subunit